MVYLNGFSQKITSKIKNTYHTKYYLCNMKWSSPQKKIVNLSKNIKSVHSKRKVSKNTDLITQQTQFTGYSLISVHNASDWNRKTEKQTNI